MRIMKFMNLSALLRLALHDIASDSGKVEIKHQRAPVSAHGRHKMKKAAP
jgi:hypothetical protein